MKTYEQFSREELIELLHKQDKELARKKYGLVWDSEKEPEQVVIDCAKKLPVLKNISKNDIKTNDDDFNIMIEGDNYHALQVLNYTHKEKIDFIYIDPPYNTGKAKEWKYNDRYIDANDGYRHSKWLNFMEKRLDLAKSLLSPNGFIAISINDIEQSNLKLLCDKVFGQNYFYAQLTWINRTQPTNMGKAMYNIQKDIDYVLVYGRKNPTQFPGFRLYELEEKSYPEKDAKGHSFRLEALAQRKNKGTLKRDSMLFPVLDISPKEGYRWQISFEKYQELKQKNRLIKRGEKIYQKIYPEDEENKSTLMPFWSHMEDVDTSQTGKKELNEILGPAQELETVKPLSLLQTLLFHMTHKNSIVLDFFAGSGTTGHAVMELNKKDCGKRHFIVCTNNEGNIASQICYPRLQKAIMGYKKYGNEEHIDGLGGNLKYFTTDFVTNSKNRTQTKINLSKRCAEMLCVKTGIFNLINNQSTSFKIYENNRRNEFLCIYFDVFGEEEISTFIKAIKNLNGKKNIFVFSLDNTVDESLFEGIKDVVIEPIPQKILDVYKSISKQHIKGIKND